jgi:hypothetical protein
MPAYVFADFVSGCASSKSAFVTGGAMATARTDFGLNTMADVLAFVSNGGLESPTFINVAPWENNPDPATPIQVDAYSFFSGLTYGYVAFLYQPKTSKWIIKSLKKNEQPDPRNLAMLAALRKAGLVN